MAARSRSSGEARAQRAAPRRAVSGRKPAGASRAKATSTKATSTKATSTKATSTKATSTKATSTKANSTRATSTKATSTKATSTKANSAKANSASAAAAPVADGRPVWCADRGDDFKTLVFGPSCALDDAAALRDALLAELADGVPLVLDGGGIERLDTAGLQLLVGLSIECMERGIAFDWRERSVALKDAVALGGVAALMDSPIPVPIRN